MGCIIKYFGSHPLLLLDPKTSKKILKRTLLKEAQDITTHLKPLTSHFEVSMISHNILFSLGSLGFEQTRNFGELTFSSSTKLQTHSFCFRNNSKMRCNSVWSENNAYFSYRANSKSIRYFLTTLNLKKKPKINPSHLQQKETKSGFYLISRANRWLLLESRSPRIY